MVVKRDSKEEKIKGLRKLDYDILQGLYDYRALSTDQIQRRYNLTVPYTYHKLRLLRISGYIEGYQISCKIAKLSMLSREIPIKYRGWIKKKNIKSGPHLAGYISGNHEKINERK